MNLANPNLSITKKSGTVTATNATTKMTQRQKEQMKMSNRLQNLFWKLTRKNKPKPYEHGPRFLVRNDK